MKSSAYISLTLSALTISAQRPSYLDFGITGVNSPGPDDSAAIFEAAGRQPNATDSVSVRPMRNSPSGSPWTLRINITELPIADDISQWGTPNATFTQGYGVANIQYQLGWPGEPDQDFESWLGERGINVTVSESFANRAANITDRYREEDEGDCTGILGEECVAALRTTNGGGTSPACRDTLGVTGGGGFQGGRGQVGGGAGTTWSGPRNASAAYNPIFQNGTMIYSTTPEYQLGNDTVLNELKSALHVFTLGIRSGSVIETIPICRIVDVEAREALELLGEDSGASIHSADMHALFAGLLTLTSLALVL